MPSVAGVELALHPSLLGGMVTFWQVEIQLATALIKYDKPWATSLSACNSAAGLTKALEMQRLSDTETDIFHVNIFQSGAVLKIVHILTADKIMAGSEEQIHSTSFQVVLM